MKKIVLFCIIAALLSGCISKTIGVNTVSSYEKRYNNTDEIVINGTKLEIADKQAIWVLRGETLEVLLSTAADKKVSAVK